MPTFDVLLTQDESGWWVATVPDLPGCVSQGSSEDEAERNLREAIALHLDLATTLIEHIRQMPEGLEDEDLERPLDYTRDVDL